ncbi:hypothetical protein TBR22_A28190 [Luteitalea sp. TBR-22]|nr:hypothetical protein TBR22_A28190 [Luteitalea sp. TBR-22]
MLVAVLTWATGGFQTSLAGLRLSSSHVLRPFVLASLAWLAGRALSGRAALPWPGAARPWLVVALAAQVAFVGVHLAPYAAAADMYGYVQQAFDWRAGSLVHPEWVTGLGDLYAGAAVPLGYVFRSAPVPAAVALYPPGTSLHMALASLAHPWAMYLVSPLAALAMVWGTWALGRQLGDERTGPVAALLVATCPIVLAQAIVPMSDTLAAAYWTGSFVCAGRGPAGRRWVAALLAGALAGAAILVRPNLAPLAAAIALRAVQVQGWRVASLAVTAMLPAVGWLAWHQATLYGAPLATGYGAPGQLFSVAHVPTNLARYTMWLWQALSPVTVLGGVAWLVGLVRTSRVPAAVVLLAGTTVGLYLVYLPWPHWTFARFLLPALPVLVVGAVITWSALTAARPLVFAGLVLIALGWQLHFTERSELRHTRTAMSRFAELPDRLKAAGLDGAFAATRLHSGSLRFYGGPRTVRWDLISRDELAAAARAARAQGRRALLIDDSDDRDAFEAAFGPLTCWVDPAAPLLTLERHAQVRVFALQPSC